MGGSNLLREAQRETKRKGKTMKKNQKLNAKQLVEFKLSHNQVAKYGNTYIYRGEDFIVLNEENNKGTVIGVFDVVGKASKAAAEHDKKEAHSA